jgi:hypothetical protein
VRTCGIGQGVPQVSSAGNSSGPSFPHSDRVTTTLMFSASIWAVGLLVAGVIAPSSRSVEGTSTQSPSATLVQVNGPRVLAAVVLPLLAVVVVAMALRWRGEKERSGAGVLAWTVSTLVGVVSLLGILTIGPFVAPVAGLLVAVCARSAVVAS